MYVKNWEKHLKPHMGKMRARLSTDKIQHNLKARQRVSTPVTKDSNKTLYQNIMVRNNDNAIKVFLTTTTQ